MSETQLAPAAARYVERMGLLWEAEGLPRIAGRMIGFLALQPDAASLDEIAAGLGVSKASVSADARHLERLSLVERVSRPGDRRDYYAIAPDMPARVVSMKLAELTELQAALADARAVTGTDGVVHARLLAFADFQHRVVTLLRDLLAALDCPAVEPTSRTTVNQT